VSPWTTPGTSPLEREVSLTFISETDGTSPLEREVSRHVRLFVDDDLLRYIPT
jgi:hypothetical protein